MRLWSLHPSHLDRRGLLALWREGLLARCVLAGQTIGYRDHPQLERFRGRRNPLVALDCYLSRIFDEGRRRGYAFDVSKIQYRPCRHAPAVVASNQMEFEWVHLLAKLKARDRRRWRAEALRKPEPHPCFRVEPGPVAPWEKSACE